MPVVNVVTDIVENMKAGKLTAEEAAAAVLLYAGNQPAELRPDLWEADTWRGLLEIGLQLKADAEDLLAWLVVTCAKLGIKLSLGTLL